MVTILNMRRLIVIKPTTMKNLALLIMITGGAYILSVPPDKPVKKHHTSYQSCSKKKCEDAS